MPRRTLARSMVHFQTCLDAQRIASKMAALPCRIMLRMFAPLLMHSRGFWTKTLTPSRTSLPSPKEGPLHFLLPGSRLGYIWHHLGREADGDAESIVFFVFHAGGLPARIQQGKWLRARSELASRFGLRLQALATFSGGNPGRVTRAREQPSECVLTTLPQRVPAYHVTPSPSSCVR